MIFNESYVNIGLFNDIVRIKNHNVSYYHVGIYPKQILKVTTLFSFNWKWLVFESVISAFLQLSVHIVPNNSSFFYVVKKSFKSTNSLLDLSTLYCAKIQYNHFNTTFYTLNISRYLCEVNNSPFSCGITSANIRKQVIFKWGTITINLDYWYNVY